MLCHLADDDECLRVIIFISLLIKGKVDDECVTYDECVTCSAIWLMMMSV
jgi:hypothetical protein